MRKSLLSVAAALVLALVAVGLVSCNDSSNPANPGGGGGLELNGSLSPSGGQYSHTFATAGTFNYKCTIHGSCSSLMGTVVVVAAGTPILNRALQISQVGGSSGAYGSSCSALSLTADTVHVGDQVTWTNNSPLPHTVTSY